MDKVIHMQARIKSKLGVESTYRGPDPACMEVGAALQRGQIPTETDACDGNGAASPPSSVGHQFEFLGAPHDYPECSYCWVVEENEVLMWIVLPKCGTTEREVMLAF